MSKNGRFKDSESVILDRRIMLGRLLALTSLTFLLFEKILPL